MSFSKCVFNGIDKSFKGLKFSGVGEVQVVVHFFALGKFREGADRYLGKNVC